MRRVFFFFALLLGISLFLAVGRFLFAIWMVAAVAALLYFAARGIRHFIRQGQQDYSPFGLPDRTQALPFPEEEPEIENLLTLYRQRPERLNSIRVIPVK